jgi:hypothetical protein
VGRDRGSLALILTIRKGREGGIEGTGTSRKIKRIILLVGTVGIIERIVIVSRTVSVMGTDQAMTI